MKIKKLQIIIKKCRKLYDFIKKRIKNLIF